MRGKQGQVTMFILLAIIVVASVVVYFMWVQPNLSSQSTKRVGFEGCVQDALEESISELALKGGYSTPQATYQYNSENYTYLCYSNEYYSLCTLQVAFLHDNFEEQLEAEIRDDVDSCYESSIDDLKSQGYDVTSGTPIYNLSISPAGTVDIQIEAPTSVGTEYYEEFEIELDSNIYMTLSIANSILQYESQYGVSDMDKLRYYYSDYDLTQVKRGDGTTIYSVSEGEDGNTFKFASRSLVWPAGYDI